MAGVIFNNFSTAFDTLSHSQIIANLSRCRTGMERELFTDYLFNRKNKLVNPVNYIHSNQ